MVVLHELRGFVEVARKQCVLVACTLFRGAISDTGLYELQVVLTNNLPLKFLIEGRHHS